MGARRTRSIVAAVGGLAICQFSLPAGAVPLPQPSPARALPVALPEPKPTRATASDETPTGTVTPDAAAPGPRTDGAPAAETAAAIAEAPPEGNSESEAAAADAEDEAESIIDKALEPFLTYSLSSRDKANRKATLNAVYRGKVSDAKRIIPRIGDETARKLAKWYLLRKNHLGAPAVEIEAFRTANPEWPNQNLMRRRAEYALFAARLQAQKVFAFFADSPPVSGEGVAALAQAHLKSGDKEKARELVASAWRNHKLDKRSEKLILARFPDMLTTADHRARIDKLLYADRKSRLARARRTADLIGKAERKKVEARAAVIRRRRNAGKLLAALSEEARAEPGVYFSRIQYLRRKKKRNAEVWQRWLKAPTDPAQIADINEWWVERRISVRTALNSGQSKIAYEIAKAHGPVTGKHYLDAKFLTGWIALRFMNDPETAHENFLALAVAATGPKDIARAIYWLGRAATALDKPTEAEAYFRSAAQYRTTYYGQIAAQTLSGGPARLELPATAEPTEEDAERLWSRDAARAIAVARAAGLERLAPLFFFQLGRTLEEPGEIAILAMLARRMKMPQASVRLSKLAFNRGLSVAEYALPRDMFPKYKELNEGVEKALVLALSRQESEFNAKAKSHAGARGLMQLMPRTARAIARSYKVRYRSANLTAKPSYNAMLGVAHLRDLVDTFGGSYIMTLCAYNAGGPRVRQWLGEFGDPRQPSKDAIDWVEQIPFTETRDYVQKILPSIQIYRSLIEGPDKALRIIDDLNRGARGLRSSTAAIEAGEGRATQN